MVAAMPDKVKESLAAMNPLKRIGEPEEVAEAAEFIFQNDYYSGRCIDLDGALRL
jgi:3-oxoacyl-[acyl-carrier protein] reductase